MKGKRNAMAMMHVALVAPLLAAAVGWGFRPQGGGIRFTVAVAPAAHAGPVTGRVLVYISHRNQPEPRLQAGSWFGTTPFFGVDVNALAGGQAAVIDGTTLGYPLANLSQLPAGDYYVQALCNVYTEFHRADGHTIWAHMDQGEGQHMAQSPGNLYSAVKQVHLDPAQASTVALTLDQVLPPVTPPADTEWIKHVKIESPMLSKFWGRPMYVGATVLLPADYKQHPEQKYPAVYVQGHFSTAAPEGFSPTPPAAGTGGRGGRGGGRGPVFDSGPRETGYEFYQAWTGADFPRMLVITFQHATPFYDDSYAVDSVNQGPWGSALTEEMIPYLESHFRIDARSGMRMLTGGSTGGWESIDLQVKHPDLFGGTWTFYPDPQDFHHFQSVDLYDDDNAFYAPEGNEWQHPMRYMMREADGQPLVTFKEMSQYEAVLGSHGRSGEQLDAFFDIFGPMGPDGYPSGLWDLQSGQIDKAAVAYARDHGYDITAYLKQNWSTLGPKLVGKLHVYVGDMDTYYLNLGVYDLENFLKTSENPHYEGTFVYGRPEKPHGWNGNMTQSQLLRLIAQNMHP